MNKTDLENLAQIRLEEAKTLLDNKHYSGAYYLCGYVVECALKACIAKNTQQYDFPDPNITKSNWTHNLAALLVNAKIDKDMPLENASTKRNRSLVIAWTEQSRYQTHNQIEAEQIYDPVANPSNGVYQWIKQRY